MGDIEEEEGETRKMSDKVWENYTLGKTLSHMLTYTV